MAALGSPRPRVPKVHVRRGLDSRRDWRVSSLYLWAPRCVGPPEPGCWNAEGSRCTPRSLGVCPVAPQAFSAFSSWRVGSSTLAYLGNLGPALRPLLPQPLGFNRWRSMGLKFKGLENRLFRIWVVHMGGGVSTPRRSIAVGGLGGPNCSQPFAIFPLPSPPPNLTQAAGRCLNRTLLLALTETGK